MFIYIAYKWIWLIFTHYLLIFVTFHPEAKSAVQAPIVMTQTKMVVAQPPPQQHHQQQQLHQQQPDIKPQQQVPGQHVVTVSGTYQPPASIYHHIASTATATVAAASSPLVMLATSAAQSSSSPVKRPLSGITEESEDDHSKKVKTESSEGWTYIKHNTPRVVVLLVQERITKIEWPNISSDLFQSYSKTNKTTSYFYFLPTSCQWSGLPNEIDEN